MKYSTRNSLKVFFSNFNPFSKSKLWLCEDGTIRSVYKNVEDAIPIPSYIESSGKISTIGNDLMDNTAELAVQWQDKIQPIIESLNEQTISYYYHIRSAYSVYQTNPCINHDFYIRQTEQIRDEENTIKKQRDAIRGLILLAKENPTNPEIIGIFREMCYQMTDRSNPNCIQREFEAAQQRAQEWVTNRGPDAS